MPRGSGRDLVPERPEAGQVAGPHHELTDVHRLVQAGDVRDRHMQARTVQQHRIDERGGEAMRRPVLFSIRSTRSRTSSGVSTVVVSSLRPFRAPNTRDGCPTD